MEAVLIKFTKEELSKLDNFKRRIEDTLDCYLDIEDCTYEDLRNFRESFEDIAKDTFRILDHITTFKFETDIESRKITNNDTIIIKNFTSTKDANLYYLQLCNEYDNVTWFKVPNNLGAGVYKYIVYNNYNKGCKCNNDSKCKQDVE